MESYATNPLCSPARSSMFTGRMPSETGVIRNSQRIRRGIPNVGHLLRQEGHETVFAGKWHLSREYTRRVPGFKTLGGGLDGQGAVGDAAVSSACEGYLRERRGRKPFLLVASFLQPHDVCQWISMHQQASGDLPFPEIADELPDLPPNFRFDPAEPEGLKGVRKYHRTKWDEQWWRYYLWSYYRMVEEADAEIGRVLQALEDSGHAGNTIVVFTSDHGEGRARHQMLTKNFLYDEAAKVPLIVSWPGHLGAGVTDTTHLASGLDITPTLCDYAGVKPPERNLGLSLRPVLEGKRAKWREFVVAEAKHNAARMVRTADYKYVMYRGDPVEQLFDMKNDPGETKNLAKDGKYTATLKEHRKLLHKWEKGLEHPSRKDGKAKGKGARPT